MSCADCAHWSEIETDCYGTRWGRCTANRERLFVLEAALKDTTAENQSVCLAFERRRE